MNLRNTLFKYHTTTVPKSKQLSKIVDFLEEVGVPKRNNDYHLIPLSGKVPVRGFPLDLVYNGEKVEYCILNGIESFGIPTGLHGLVVIDFDDPEIFKRFRKICPFEYLKTLVIRTKRGFHLYYVITDEALFTKPSQRFRGVDIKTGRSYVVAPFSIVGGFEYKKDEELSGKQVKNIRYVELQKILDLLFSLFEKRKKERKEERKEEGKEEKKKKTDKYETYKERVIEVIRKYYLEGKRQDIVLGLSGVCRKAGINKDVVLDIIEKLHRECDDTDSIRQRFSAVELTYKKDIAEVAGWGILKEMLSQEDVETLKGIVEKDLIEAEVEDVATVDDDEYLLVDGYWYKKVVKNNEITLKQICKGYKVESRYETESQKVSYTIRLSDNKVKRLHELDIKQLEKLLGEPFLSEKDAKRIFAALIRRAKEKYLYERTGWVNNSVFLHPAIKYDNIELSLKVQSIIKNEDFMPCNSNIQHALVKKVLEEGKLLALKYVFAVASLFSSFTVIDVAPKGTGKTLTSAVAIQLFYRCENPLTTDATKTAMELMLHSLKNMPILFDETALSVDDKIQALIFMVASRQGKGRGTKYLTVNTIDLESVVFLTSEREIELDRFGAFRRFIMLNPLSFKDYTEVFKNVKDLIEFKNTCWGCGVDYIKHYIQKRDNIRVANFLNYKDFSDFPQAVEKAVALLEDYYGVEFHKTKDALNEVFKEQNNEVEKDIIDIFIDYLKDFITVKSNNFIHFLPGGIIEERPKADIYGCIEKTSDTKKVYIITSVFQNFCNERNLPQKIILKLARERKLLESPPGSFRIAKRMPLVGIVPAYCFVID